MIIHLKDLMDLQNSNRCWRQLTTIFFLSLAGIPLTAGFLSKFYMLKAAMGYRQESMAGYLCRVDGGGKCLLLFPGYTGHVF